MGTPSLSYNTDTFSNAPLADSDDEGPQSSMWVQQEGHTSSELPPDFLEPLSPGDEVISPLPPLPTRSHGSQQQSTTHESRQFWKSGDFTGSYEGAAFATEGMDHARVHPKFLHSNATSHKWVLGAIAELLDNAVDEIRNGATYVKVDVVPNPRNKEPMLVIEDDGGGMDPECMRRCMSLGYSAKSKLSNTIGQYGNGFKTSTMRLGADVMVLTRSRVGKSSESVGMLSYTFLTATGQNDVIVPIVDFQIEAFGIRKLIRSNVEDWVESMEAIESWSPFSSQAELVNQFKTMPRRQGTRVIIYNLWEDDEGLPELDLTTDPNDIQIRSTTRDEKTLKMATTYPSCWHYLTYRHSLRTYTSILYLRLPSRFRIFLRGKQVLHHNLKNEMMLVEEVTYKPKDAGHSKAVVTLGFVKDAKEHLDISGFNVYHKNRLIKPFWRIWNPSDTRGRGIIAILEANFVEPAHDKQGFERTIVLSRLEARLTEMQKTYFSKHCHKIGYINASLKKKSQSDSGDNNKKAANAGTLETAQGNAQHMSRVNSTAAKVCSSANGGRDVSHVQVSGKQSEPLAVSSALTTRPMQEASATPARLEMQKHLSSIDAPTPTIGVGKHKSGFLGRQGSVHTPQEGIFSEKAPLHLQHAALKSAGLDSQPVHPPASADVPLYNLQITSLGPAHPPSSSVMTAVIIDLDSPDNDPERDVAAFELPCMDDCDPPKPKSEKSLPEMINMMGGDSAGESIVVSRERSDDTVGLEGNEARGLIGASCSLLEVPFLDKVETLPGMFGVEGCSQLATKTVSSLDKVELRSPVEARAESPGMESHALLSETVSIPMSKQAPSTMPIPGFEEMSTIQTNEDTGELGTESFLQVKTVIENTPCSDITMIDAADVDASDPLKSSTFFVEGHVSAVFDLDDLFDSPIQQDEAKPLSPQSIKAGEASVISPFVAMDVNLPDILENAILENDTLSLVNSSEILNENDNIVGMETDSNVAEENPTDNTCQLPHKDVEKSCASIESLSKMDIQRVAGVPTEMDATTIGDFEEKEDACPVAAKQILLENDDLQHVSGPVVDQSLAMPVTTAEDDSGSEQEGRSTLLSHRVMHVVDTSPINQASSEGLQKDMARVSQGPTSIQAYNQALQQGTTSFQASNEALQQIVAVVHETAPPAAPTSDISISSDGNLSCEDGSSRLLFAKQARETLQQSIGLVVAEADDLREQLQQQRCLQDLDMRNLNMELERALLRLEELQR